MSVVTNHSVSDALTQRVVQLEQLFQHIAETRMRDVPIVHDELYVEAVGFNAVSDNDGRLAACGILLTPWFMNLVWLPLDDVTVQTVGQTVVRDIGETSFEFTGVYDDQYGVYEMCSLFSPMLEFEDQLAARRVAEEILGLLRTITTDQVAATKPDRSRRAFLFGRSDKA
jgi:[NiFe] hydrogenase assembly HybE family chaperone